MGSCRDAALLVLVVGCVVGCSLDRRGITLRGDDAGMDARIPDTGRIPDT
ncbi:MAG: hypothetical protein IT379_38655, partial [Deltaproteobacteria bacterium]|nr:hypothetical protein [Deltaproteobacteria bacterium]